MIDKILEKALGSGRVGMFGVFHDPKEWDFVQAAIEILAERCAKAENYLMKDYRWTPEEIIAAAKAAETALAKRFPEILLP